MTDPSHKPTLVLGATGKTGRRVADRLDARGLPVRHGSRRAAPAFDWADPDGWPAVLAGAGAAYITYQPDLAAAGAPEAIARFAATARDAGVQRLVLLSGRGEAEAQRAEEGLAASGAEWTVVRASWFAQNFSESFLLDAVQDGTLALPVADVPEPFIDADDIADVAVAALTEPGHASRVYEVTGPRLLTFQDAVAEIGAAAGRDIRFERIPAEAYRAGLADAGVPDDLANLVLYLLATVLDGRNAHVADGVERALGRPPRDFADYARATAATGLWNAAARAS